MSVKELRDAPLRNEADVKAAVDDLLRKANELVRAVNAVPEGPPGPKGDKGLKGDIGIQGPPGGAGGAGPKGDKGPPGFDGKPGDMGLPGVQGKRGLQGVPGIMGMPGLDGKQGPDGLPGQRGIAGPAGTGTSRGKVTKITAVIANTVEESGSFVLAKSFLLHRVVTSGASRIRLYDSAALRDLDQPRAVGADPAPGQSGIVVDLNLDASMLDFTLSPMTAGANQDPTSNLVYYLIQNKSGAGAAITVDFYVTILAA